MVELDGEPSPDVELPIEVVVSSTAVVELVAIVPVVAVSNGEPVPEVSVLGVVDASLVEVASVALISLDVLAVSSGQAPSKQTMNREAQGGAMGP